MGATPVIVMLCTNSALYVYAMDLKEQTNRINTDKLVSNKPNFITDLDELHPLYALGADGHHGEADGGANNAVSPRDGQFEEGGDELPDGGP